jgi:hypothetical protein
MEPDIITLTLNFLVIFIYGAICIISIIFTFFIDTYHKVDETLNLKIISGRALTPLEENINLIDNWLIEHHKIVGPILICLSLFDMKLFLGIIKLI